jgi:hypothetical protein
MGPNGNSEKKQRSETRTVEPTNLVSNGVVAVEAGHAAGEPADERLLLVAVAPGGGGGGGGGLLVGEEVVVEELVREPEAGGRGVELVRHFRPRGGTATASVEGTTPYRIIIGRGRPAIAAR